MKTANINRFILLLRDAFDALGIPVGMAHIEQMAVQVHNAMESPRRRYHCSEHAIGLCKGMGPLQILAAVFHDVVYYQLDNGFPPRVAHHLTPLVSHQGNDLVLLKLPAEDKAMQMCLDVFGFVPGQALPLFRGMNEFLSAAVAVRLLQPHLQMADLLTVITCIETTIPFRAPEPDGRDCITVLADRVRTQAVQCLGITERAPQDAFVDSVMATAVALANRDVGGFAEPHHGKFLSGTWLLIEESNAPLASVGVYTLQDYRSALARMHDFLESLQAPRVFQHYKTFGEKEYHSLTAAAGTNIAFAVSFLRLKILSIAIIEALALETGGNCPVSLFLGDIRSRGEDPERVEDYLPPGPDSPGLDPLLLQVLEQGRPEDVSNDLAVSPLTAYIYRCMGRAGCEAALTVSKRMHAGEVTPREFLRSINTEMRNAIMDACMRIAISRQARLLQLRAALTV